MECNTSLSCETGIRYRPSVSCAGEMVLMDRSAVLHSSANYAAVMIGDECGRLTVLSFSVGETRRVELEKIDFGMVRRVAVRSDARYHPPRHSSPLVVTSSLSGQPLGIRRSFN